MTRSEQVNVWEYLETYHADRSEILKLVDEVFSSGNLILGENVKSFEEEFSSWCGARFGVGVANGTDAIFLALKSLNVGEGDEVITVSNTAVPTVSAIIATGATPVLIDIEAEGYLINADLIENSINKKTKCLLMVHLYGQMVNMDKVQELANAHGLWLVEDCAQAHGAEFNGKKAGSFGDVAAFSFYPTKILGTYGDGGMCLTKDEGLAEKLRSLRFYGMTGRYFSESEGFNSRLDEVHASILRFKLQRLDEEIKKRRLIADWYNELLDGTELKLPNELSKRKHAYYLYVVAHENRDKIMKTLKDYDINLNISYPWPIHIMPAFKDKSKFISLKTTERCAKNIFSLPMFPSLSREKVERVAEALKAEI